MAAIDELELSVIIPEPENPSVLKKIRHKNLTIDSDLEMTQVVEVTYFVNDNGVPGLPKLQEIQENENYTREQKAKYEKMFATQTYPTSTRGFKVDPLTGQEAALVEGQYPPEAISELEYWQSFPKETFTQASLAQLAPGVDFFPGNTLAELIYNGLLLSAIKMIQRNRI